MGYFQCVKTPKSMRKHTIKGNCASNMQLPFKEKNEVKKSRKKYKTVLPPSEI